MAISPVVGYPSSHAALANMGKPGRELHFLVEKSSRDGQRCLQAPPGSCPKDKRQMKGGGWGKTGTFRNTTIA